MDADNGWLGHIAESGAIKMQLRLMFLAVGALFTANVAVLAAVLGT